MPEGAPATVSRRLRAALPKGEGRSAPAWTTYREVLGWSGWLAYGVPVSRILERVMRARICRPGSTYGRWDRGKRVSRKKICRPGSTYGGGVEKIVYVEKNLQARFLRTRKRQVERTVEIVGNVDSWKNRWLGRSYVRRPT